MSGCEAPSFDENPMREALTIEELDRGEQLK